jgi:hypothetical protein
MTTQHTYRSRNLAAATRPAGDIPEPAPSASAPPSWPWRRAALLLSIAAQVITIAALEGADPLAVTWAALLLAIAPGPLTAVVAFAPAPAARLAAVLDAAILTAGILGGIVHTGLFFVPALAMLAVAGVKLWHERS